MTPSKVRAKVTVDRAVYVRKMVGQIRSLPLSSLDAFAADFRNVASAESFLRRGLDRFCSLNGRDRLPLETESFPLGKEVRAMEALKLEIPEEVLRSLKIPPDEVEEELRKELAVALYERKALSLGKARFLARMTRWQFHEFLGKRKVARHYAVEDLQEDLAYGRSGR